jgi:hypothetical protein
VAGRGNPVGRCGAWAGNAGRDENVDCGLEITAGREIDDCREETRDKGWREPAETVAGPTGTFPLMISEYDHPPRLEATTLVGRSTGLDSEFRASDN